MKDYLIAPFGKQDMILSLVIEKRHKHCRSLKVFAGDFFLLTMTEDFLNLLFQGSVIISLLKPSIIGQFSS